MGGTKWVDWHVRVQSKLPGLDYEEILVPHQEPLFRGLTHVD